MPKNTNVPQELDRLMKLEKEDPAALHQFVTRVSVSLAVKVLQECAAKKELPAHALRAMIEHRFSKSQLPSEFSTLSPSRLRAIEAAAQKLGIPTTELLERLVDEKLVELLRKLKDEQNELNG